MKKTAILIMLFITNYYSQGQNFDTIRLLPPQLDKGKSLMQSLNGRHSAREFSNKKLSLQELSNLLWAANGINRSGEQKHTAPTSMNRQEMDIYVFLEEGVYQYEPHKMILEPILKGDKRKEAGKQDYVGTAPVNLVYVADYSRMGQGPDEGKATTASADAAFIGQNVYLFCSAFDLNCVIRGLIDKESVSRLLSLSPSQRVQLGQTVGYPK